MWLHREFPLQGREQRTTLCVDGLTPRTSGSAQRPPRVARAARYAPGDVLQERHHVGGRLRAAEGHQQEGVEGAKGSLAHRLAPSGRPTGVSTRSILPAGAAKAISNATFATLNHPPQQPLSCADSPFGRRRACTAFASEQDRIGPAAPLCSW